MQVSLNAFLRTGELGETWIGKTAGEMVGYLGLPDAEGGTSRKHRRPSVYLYGIVEFYFSRDYPYACIGIFVDYEKADQFRFVPEVEVVDWPWTRDSKRTEAEAYLREQALVETKVRLSFDEEDRLVALYFQEKSPHDS